jgi:hypothetical protein
VLIFKAHQKKILPGIIPFDCYKFFLKVFDAKQTGEYVVLPGAQGLLQFQEKVCRNKISYISGISKFYQVSKKKQVLR